MNSNGFNDTSFVIMEYIIYALLVISVGLGIYFIARRLNKVKQLQRYRQINLGMSERQMLNIMGDGYNKSLLKDGVTQYIWHLAGQSSGYVYNGFVSVQNDSGQKVIITCKNGMVEEVIPINVRS